MWNQMNHFLSIFLIWMNQNCKHFWVNMFSSITSFASRWRCQSQCWFMHEIMKQQLYVKQISKILTMLFSLFCWGMKIVLSLYMMNESMFSVMQHLIVCRIFSSIPETMRSLKSNLSQHEPPNFRAKTSNHVRKLMSSSDRKSSNNFSFK